VLTEIVVQFARNAAAFFLRIDDALHQFGAPALGLTALGAGRDHQVLQVRVRARHFLNFRLKFLVERGQFFVAA